MDKNIFGEKELFIEDIPESDKPSDPIIKDAFNRIWEKLQQSVYRWKQFKTDLPFAINPDNSRRDSGIAAQQNERQRHHEDLHAMCHDENGRRKRLNTSQHIEIAETGRFTVKSSIDEQYDNVWLLGSFLQLGRQETSRRLNLRKERANRHWYLYLPEYFSADNPRSMRQGLVNIKQSIVHVFRVIFGFTEYSPRYTDWFIDTLIQKQRISFLFADSSPLKDDLLLWMSKQGIELNVLLANPELRAKTLELISQVQQQLESSGDILDTSLLEALKIHPELISIHPQLPELLEKLHHFCLQLSEKNPGYQTLFAEKLKTREQQLIRDYPYRGRYEEWRIQQLENAQVEIHQSVIDELASELSNTLGKGAEQYLLERNRLFNGQPATNIRDRLSKLMRLSLSFKISRLIWSFDSPDKISRLGISTRHLATNRLFWRPCYFLVYGWQFLSDSCIRLLRALIYSPMGINYFFTLSKTPFMGEQWISSDGKIKGSKEFPTHITHIQQHVDLIKRYRGEFESKSDYGLFPRSVGRIFNKIYCYVMVGLIGITLNMLIHYGLFFMFTVLATLALILAPLWVPVYTILAYLCSVLIYDWVGPLIYFDGRKALLHTAYAPLLQTVFYHFLIRGIGLILLNVLGIIMHVLALPLLHLLANLLYGLRTFWDLMMRVIFIRHFARIPGDNFSGLITRIAGYGIAHEILEEVTRDEARNIYTDWLELFVLNEYEPLFRENLYLAEKNLEQIMTPVYRSIIDEQYYPLSEQLGDHLTKLQETFRLEFNPYHSVLEQRLHTKSMRYIRLSQDDLADFIAESETLTRQYIESSLLHYMSPTQIASFWLDQATAINDWTALNRVMLENAFSPDIFTPVEACDASISIRNNEVNMVRSLIKNKEPSVKVAFDVNGNAATVRTATQLSFRNNAFWSQLYHPLYLPVESDAQWQYLSRIRRRALTASA